MPTLTELELEETTEFLVRESRTDFVAFLHTLWPQVPRQSYTLSKFHAWLAEYIQGVLQTEGPVATAVSVPPQHGKSRMIAVRAVAWYLGAKPGVAVALTGFSRPLLTDFMHEIQAIVDAPLYQRMFPDMHTSFGRDRADSKNFSNGSSIIAKSSESKLTGRRVDLLIVDDPHAGREEAESATMRAKVRRWYFADCVTRLSPDAKQILIATRWHLEDLIGELTSEKYVNELIRSGYPEKVFKVVNLPAIAEDNDPMGRKEGEALFPEDRPVRFLNGVKASIPPYEWESQYRGRPQSSGSGQVSTQKILRVPLMSLPFARLEFIRGWDLALTTAKSSDYTAGALLAYDKEADFLYLVDMFHGKKVWEDVKRTIATTALRDKEEWGAQRMGMEAVTGFSIGFDELQKLLLGEVSMEKRNPVTDKLLRARSWLNKVEAGKVAMVDGTWNSGFISELASFPQGSHDDQVDAVSIAWECFTKNKKKLLFA